MVKKVHIWRKSSKKGPHIAKHFFRIFHGGEGGGVRPPTFDKIVPPPYGRPCCGMSNCFRVGVLLGDTVWSQPLPPPPPPTCYMYSRDKNVVSIAGQSNLPLLVTSRAPRHNAAMMSSTTEMTANTCMWMIQSGRPRSISRSISTSTVMPIAI